MDFRLKIAGLAAAAVVFGAFLGKSIDTTPRYFGEDAWASPARHETGMAESGIYDFDDDLPDHYPMITPRGRVEVSELSLYMRGPSMDYRLWHDDGFMLPPPHLDLELDFVEDVTSPELVESHADIEPGAVFPEAGLRLSGNPAVQAIAERRQAPGAGQKEQGHHAARLDQDPAGRSRTLNFAARLKDNAR